MKKIITAINNPRLNEELKKEKNFEIIGKDIQYKEAILEVLETNNNIDLIIISESIPGEIETEKLIKKIKQRDETIKIIFILEKENKELENILLINNIKEIYYNNIINLKELIEIINKKEINMEEEIIKLKKIIEEKNKIEKRIDNIEKDEKVDKNRSKKIKEKLKGIKILIKSKVKKECKQVDKDRFKSNMLTKIITFSGNYKSGKTTLSLIISQYLSNKNYKVLLIDGDLEKQDLSTILKKEERKNKKQRNKCEKRDFYEKYFYNRKNNANKFNLVNTKRSELNNKKLNKVNFKRCIKLNYKKIKLINRKNKINYYQIKTNIKDLIFKINKNLYFFNGLKSILKNKNNKKIKEIIFILLKIIKSNYDFIIVDLSKSNLESINKEILRNSHINFMVMESNLLGVKEMQRLIEVYVKNWKVEKYSLHIVQNKRNISSMSKKLIGKFLSYQNKIFEIKENKFYYLMTNQYYKRKILLKNKAIKKELNKIINKIIFK